MAGNKHDSRGDHDIHVPDLERPEARHEESDINAWAVGKFAIALVIISIFTFALLLGVFKFFLDRESAEKPPINGIGIDARRLPPQPRLEETPILDLKQMRDAEDKILNSYGWMDKSKGVVRIPISQAIDLLAQRGLPSRPENGVQSASTASVPTESGLGAKVQQPGGPLAGAQK